MKIKSIEFQAIESGLSCRFVMFIKSTRRVNPRPYPAWFIGKFSLAAKVYDAYRDGDTVNTGQLLNVWT